MLCDCTTSEQERAMGIRACGDDCLNRMLMIECGKHCACAEHCTNRNFRNKCVANVAPFLTDMKGYGIKTLVDMNA